MSSKTFIFMLIVAILIGGVTLFAYRNIAVDNQKAYLMLRDKKIELTVAVTSESRTRGLGGMESLPENSAMLFVFDDFDRYGIWMKDMKFSIDIIWTDEKGIILHVEKNVSPETYPKVFFPPQKSLYILEANAGFADENSLTVGKKLDFILR